MNEKELKKRTKQFALRIMKLVNALPKNIEGQSIGKQLIRLLKEADELVAIMVASRKSARSESTNRKSKI